MCFSFAIVWVSIDGLGEGIVRKIGRWSGGTCANSIRDQVQKPIPNIS